MDKTEALARAVEALRAADYRNAAAELEATGDPLRTLRFLLSEGAPEPGSDSAALDAVAALHLVLRGYEVTEPGHGPPPA